MQVIKPEPLKGKTYRHGIKNNLGEVNQLYPHHYDRDIKSAVEWYLIEQKKEVKDNPLYDEWVKSKSKLHYKAWLVLKAFEDVTNK